MCYLSVGLRQRAFDEEAVDEIRRDLPRAGTATRTDRETEIPARKETERKHRWTGDENGTAAYVGMVIVLTAR